VKARTGGGRRQGWYTLYKQMSNPAHLSHLDLRGCQLTAEDARQLMDRMNEFSSLSSLDLSMNPLGPKGMKVVLMALAVGDIQGGRKAEGRTSRALSTLLLNSIGLSDHNSGVLALVGLRHNLSCITLGKNNLADRAALVLHKSLPGNASQLTSLDLSDNYLSDVGGYRLLEAAERCTNMKMLILNGNPVSSELLQRARSINDAAARWNADAAAPQRKIRSSHPGFLAYQRMTSALKLLQHQASRVSSLREALKTVRDEVEEGTWQESSEHASSACLKLVSLADEELKQTVQLLSSFQESVGLARDEVGQSILRCEEEEGEAGDRRSESEYFFEQKLKEMSIENIRRTSELERREAQVARAEKNLAKRIHEHAEARAKLERERELTDLIADETEQTCREGELVSSLARKVYIKATHDEEKRSLLEDLYRQKEARLSDLHQQIQLSLSSLRQEHQQLSEDKATQRHAMASLREAEKSVRSFISDIQASFIECDCECGELNPQRMSLADMPEFLQNLRVARDKILTLIKTQYETKLRCSTQEKIIQLCTHGPASTWDQSAALEDSSAGNTSSCSHQGTFATSQPFASDACNETRGTASQVSPQGHVKRNGASDVKVSLDTSSPALHSSDASLFPCQLLHPHREGVGGEASNKVDSHEAEAGGGERGRWMQEMCGRQQADEVGSTSLPSPPHAPAQVLELIDMFETLGDVFELKSYDLRLKEIEMEIARA